MKPHELAGQRFGRLVAIKRGANIKDSAGWECRCDCGETVHVAASRLTRGVRRSCGCIGREKTRHSLLTHGCTGQPLYKIWKGIKQRCLNQRSHLFPYYGGRGITIVEPWRSDFLSFQRDIEPRPSPDHSLDRIDNSRHYEPGNMRWASRLEQANNKRNNLVYEFQGERKTLAEWARTVGIRRGVLHDRLIRYGWPVERALTESVRPY